MCGIPPTMYEKLASLPTDMSADINTLGATGVPHERFEVESCCIGSPYIKLFDMLVNHFKPTAILFCFLINL